MTQRFCKVCRGWHELDAWPSNCMPEVIGAPSDLPMPSFISDAMPPTQSMVDGKTYESKSALRSTYQPSGNAEGKRYVEVGNDAARLRPRQKPKVDRKKVRQSIEKAEARFNRGERA